MLRFIRDSWDTLNGSMLKDNKKTSLGLLECTSPQVNRRHIGHVLGVLVHVVNPRGLLSYTRICDVYVKVPGNIF